MEKDLELSPNLPDCSKDSRKVFALVYIYNWSSLVFSLWHYRYKNLNILRTVHNFSTKKKIFNLYLRWHILKNYRFVAEVTLKKWMQKILDTVIGEKQKLLK